MCHFVIFMLYLFLLSMLLSWGCWWLGTHDWGLAQYEIKWLHDDEVGMMVEHCHSTRLVKTTTQLYGLPHAKAKVKSSLLHQNMEFYNTANNCNWKPKLWLDNFWPIICRIDFIGCWSGIVNSAPYDRGDSWITIDWLSDIHSKHTISCDHCHC